MDTPYSYNEIITPNSNTNDGNNKYLDDIKQNKNDILSIKFRRLRDCFKWYLYLIFYLFFILIYLFYQITNIIKDQIHLLLLNIPLFITIIYLFILLFNDKRRIEIIKEENQNEKIIIKIIHWFYNNTISKKNMKDIHFEIDESKFFIVNDFPNKEEIDSDFNNIKNIPLELYEVFQEIKNDSSNLEFELNNFINKTYEERLCNFIRQFKFIKINDKFLTFFKNDPLETIFFGYDLLFWIIIIFELMIIIGINLNLNKFKNKKSDLYNYFISILFDLIFIFINIIIIKIINSYKRKIILRLDRIYSKNKDRIFIGLVTFFNTYYKTFEFNEMKLISLIKLI